MTFAIALICLLLVLVGFGLFVWKPAVGVATICAALILNFAVLLAHAPH